MLPSPRLIILVMAAAPLFLAGALYEGAAAVGVLYVIVLALYTSLDALLLPRRRHIAVTRSIPERISVGYPTVMRFTVENRTRRRIQVQLAQDGPEEIDISADAVRRPSCDRGRPPSSNAASPRTSGARTSWDASSSECFPPPGCCTASSRWTCRPRSRSFRT